MSTFPPPRRFSSPPLLSTVHCVQHPKSSPRCQIHPLPHRQRRRGTGQTRLQARPPCPCYHNSCCPLLYREDLPSQAYPLLLPLLRAHKTRIPARCCPSKTPCRYLYSPSTFAALLAVSVPCSGYK